MRLRLSLALALTLAAALAACGEESSGGGAQAVGESQVGSVAPLVQCRDWNGANEAEKLATIEEVRAGVDLSDGPVKTPPLSDDQAMELFENTCAHEFSDGFRLYKVYARAQGFQSLLEPVD